MVGLNAALTYSRVMAHSVSRSGRLPIHTPGRYWVRVTSGVPTMRNDLRRNLRLFILSHTRVSAIEILTKLFMLTSSNATIQLKSTHLDSDLIQLRNSALTLGAKRALTIDTKRIFTDERVRLKCRYPPCRQYGRNLMCPPFTPSASEFKRYLSRYRKALLVEIEGRVPDDIKQILSNKKKRYADLIEDEDFMSRYRKWHVKVWGSLHQIVSDIEREAFRRNYYFSLGLGAEHCMLCQTCNIEGLCRQPLKARPSMEALGIDVHKTLSNVGLTLKWDPIDAIHLYGLVLIG